MISWRRYRRTLKCQMWKNSYFLCLILSSTSFLTAVRYGRLPPGKRESKQSEEAVTVQDMHLIETAELIVRVSVAYHAYCSTTSDKVAEINRKQFSLVGGNLRNICYLFFFLGGWGWGGGGGRSWMVILIYDTFTFAMTWCYLTCQTCPVGSPLDLTVSECLCSLGLNISV